MLMYVLFLLPFLLFVLFYLFYSPPRLLLHHDRLPHSFLSFQSILPLLSSHSYGNQYHPTKPELATVTATGEVLLWKERTKYKWNAYIPPFIALDTNIDCNEQEEEKDGQDENGATHNSPGHIELRAPQAVEGETNVAVVLSAVTIPEVVEKVDVVEDESMTSDKVSYLE